MLEITSLSDKVQAFVLGVQALEAMEFTYNYTQANYETVKDTARTDMYYELSFGTNGSEGTFQWQGQHDTYVDAAGVNEVANAIMVIAATTMPTLKESA